MTLEQSEKSPKSSDYKEGSCQTPLSKAFQKNNSLNCSTAEPGTKSVLYAALDGMKVSLLHPTHLLPFGNNLPDPKSSTESQCPFLHSSLFRRHFSPQHGSLKNPASSSTSLSHRARRCSSSSGLSYKSALAGSGSQHGVSSSSSPLEEQQSRELLFFPKMHSHVYNLPPQDSLPMSMSQAHSEQTSVSQKLALVVQMEILVIEAREEQRY